MSLSEAREACSEPELDCKTELTCSKFVKCRNVTRNTNNVRDRRFRRRHRHRHLRHHFGLFNFRHLRVRRDSPSLPRRSVVCSNVHTTRKVTVCCKYICSNTARSNKEVAEIFQRRFFRFGWQHCILNRDVGHSVFSLFRRARGRSRRDNVKWLTGGGGGVALCYTALSYDLPL